MRTRRDITWLSVLATAWILAALPGCQQNTDTHTERFFAFGTLVELSVAGADPEQAQRGVMRIRESLRVWDKEWNPWENGSKLAILNRKMSAGLKATADPELLGMVKSAQQAYQTSSGLFNPALGELIRLWGLHDETQTPQQPPAATDVKEMIGNAPTMDDLVIAENDLYSTHPLLLLDFGAIAKGYAIDRLRPVLASMKLTNYILNIGGDLCAAGNNNGKSWVIGVRHPRRPGVLSTLEIADDECVFTSGDYERFFFHDNKRFHHILDPRDGYPARGAVSVTVVHRLGALADAAATAIFVADVDKWQQIAEDMNISLVMLIDTQGRIHMSDALAARMQFADGHSRKQVVLRERQDPAKT